MAHIVEVRNGRIVDNDEPADIYLPVGTTVSRTDGFYISVGMDLDGPFDKPAAEARLDHLRRMTRLELEGEDRKKQAP